LPACGRKLTYADDVDTNALKASFKCGGSTTGDRARACRIIDDFASAGSFESAPAKGHEAWVGQLLCTDGLDLPDSMNFAGVYLMPGPGEKTWPDDVKTDPARDLPYGAHFGNQYVSKITPESQKSEYAKTIEAAEKGSSPDFTNLEAFDRERMDRFWAGLKKPSDMANRKYHRLVRSNRTSVLGNPFTSETKMRPSATYFVRAKPPRMIVVYPGSKEPGSAPKPNVPDCVAELWKISGEP
jgi:hypothetical protein